MVRLSRIFLITGVTLLTLILVLSRTPQAVRSYTCEDTCSGKDGDEKLACLSDVKKDCEAKLSDTANKKASLQNTVNIINNKISLAQAQINETTAQIEALEKDIESLSGKISTLNFSLDQIAQALTHRIKASYKHSRIQPIDMLLVSQGVGDFVNRYKYLKTLQENDRELMIELETTRKNYDIQKVAKEEKQAKVLGLQTELVNQKKVLDKQQKEKEYLLVVTKHEESRYQGLLTKALAELAAIQDIIAGRGNETQVGSVNEGDKIASIIPSASACSNGAHLHFEVSQSASHLNPANFLQPKSMTWNNEPDGPFAFTGSWPWPINEPIRITQGYGMTFYAATLHYYGGGPHTGIDMANVNDWSVKAVRKGTLYRGSIACGGGTLKYVHVDHSDDGYDTYYLHVNYF